VVCSRIVFGICLGGVLVRMRRRGVVGKEDGKGLVAVWARDTLRLTQGGILSFCFPSFLPLICPPNAFSFSYPYPLVSSSRAPYPPILSNSHPPLSHPPSPSYFRTNQPQPTNQPSATYLSRIRVPHPSQTRKYYVPSSARRSMLVFLRYSFACLLV
jgi:hypothetical protein